MKLFTFLALIIVSNSGLIGFNNPVSAQDRVKKSTSSNSNSSNYGLPTYRRDGGSRGGGDNCMANANGSNLVALIPDQTVGINAAASPTLFFYVPEVSREKTIEFVLRNEQDQLLYEAFLTTPGRGIMSVEIPEEVNANKLEANQNYHWYLSMICNPQQRSRDVVVEGWMRQEKPDRAVAESLNVADPIAKAELYNESGFWYDALSTLAEQQEVDDQPVVEEKWSELLESVGLEKFAAEPFIDSKTITTSESSQ